MNTTIRKNHYGIWKAETTLMLDDIHQLSISTTKHNNELRTLASVGKVDNGYISHVLYQDYMRVVASMPTKRVSEKTITATHHALDIVTIVNDAKQFYNI